MKNLVVMILLTALMTSCNIVTDNTGKCFSMISDKYNDPRYYLVFNSDDDFIFWDSIYDVYGPLSKLYIFGTEIPCPEKLHIRPSLKNDLNRHGVYDEISKFINISTDY